MDFSYYKDKFSENIFSIPIYEALLELIDNGDENYLYLKKHYHKYSFKNVQRKYHNDKINLISHTCYPSYSFIINKTNNVMEDGVNANYNIHYNYLEFILFNLYSPHNDEDIVSVFLKNKKLKSKLISLIKYENNESDILKAGQLVFKMFHNIYNSNNKMFIDFSKEVLKKITSLELDFNFNNNPNYFNLNFYNIKNTRDENKKIVEQDILENDYASLLIKQLEIKQNKFNKDKNITLINFLLKNKYEITSKNLFSTFFQLNLHTNTFSFILNNLKEKSDYLFTEKLFSCNNPFYLKHKYISIMYDYLKENGYNVNDEVISLLKLKNKYNKNNNIHIFDVIKLLRHHSDDNLIKKYLKSDVINQFYFINRNQFKSFVLLVDDVFKNDDKEIISKNFNFSVNNITKKGYQLKEIGNNNSKYNLLSILMEKAYFLNNINDMPMIKKTFNLISRIVDNNPDILNYFIFNHYNCETKLYNKREFKNNINLYSVYIKSFNFNFNYFLLKQNYNQFTNLYNINNINTFKNLGNLAYNKYDKINDKDNILRLVYFYLNNIDVNNLIKNEVNILKNNEYIKTNYLEILLQTIFFKVEKTKKYNDIREDLNIFYEELSLHNKDELNAHILNFFFKNFDQIYHKFKNNHNYMFENTLFIDVLKNFNKDNHYDFLKISIDDNQKLQLLEIFEFINHNPKVYNIQIEEKERFIKNIGYLKDTIYNLNHKQIRSKRIKI